MPEAVIVDAIRTPIGRAGKGSLKTVRADDLAAIPLRALMERNPGVDFGQTNDVMMGAASSIGEQGTTSAATRHCWRGSTTTCRRAR
jgi:acetyl-CoA C-acetyltransferase